MRWQKIARIVIVLAVIAFAGIVFLAMRKRAGVPTRQEEVRRGDPTSTLEATNSELKSYKDNKESFSLKFARQFAYSDGRVKFEGVTMTLPDRNGKTIVVTSAQADVIRPQDKINELTSANLKGSVRLETSNGVVITSEEATYDGKTDVVTIPGPVQFSRGRMKGSGVGASYDKGRDVTWINSAAKVNVAPDASGGGAIEASANKAGLARAENYMKLSENAHIVSDGRTADAADITILLDESGEKVQQLQLREQSRMTGNGSGAQSMMARNIDMIYATDGRTLQSSRLMENAVVELPSDQGGAAKRIAGSTIDITMSPDGATVTNLNAQEKVQVDLPAAGDTPAKQIKSATLRAAGAAGQGLQNAVFEGGVDYFESKPAAGKSPAIERRARSQRLVVDTKPGFGEVERADFHGNVKFTDAEISAEAPRALYAIDKDQLELTPSTGDPGTGPILTNSQFTVQARNIQVSPTTQKLHADTDVRSIVKPQSKTAPASGTGTGGAAKSGGSSDAARVPAMLKQDRPVNVTANRLDYDGVAEATYSGNALLFQDQSRIAADTIISNDQTGNLTAKVNVRTTMILQDQDPKTKVSKPSETRVTADNMVYDDAKRLAIYTATGTTLAHLTSAQGDIKGNRIDLYLKESGNELERAESDGTVSVRQDQLFATGRHLVYTADNDTYVLVGQPVVSIQKDDEGKCKQTEGSTLTYERAADRIRVEAMPGLVPSNSKPLPACPAELRH
jgi:lipopolysaccharide export system protein LptA